MVSITFRIESLLYVRLNDFSYEDWIFLLSAFKSCGITPRDNSTILRKNPGFTKLTQADADWLLSQIEPLSRLHSDAAFIPEAVYDKLFQGREHLVPAEPLPGKPLGELSYQSSESWIWHAPCMDWIDEEGRACEDGERGMLARPVVGLQRSLSQTGNVAILDAQVPRLWGLSIKLGLNVLQSDFHFGLVIFLLVMMLWK